jgi:hypothetical protein
MPSISYGRWTRTAAAKLDQMEAAHSSVGGTARGRRYATDQLNHVYAVLLASQFQGFCRDLHTESANHLVAIIEPAAMRPIVRAAFTKELKLEKGNANPGNLGADFKRLGLEFWPEVVKLDPRNSARQKRLDLLNLWRNAIAHQDFDSTKLGATTIGLAEVKQWRATCRGLARAFDRVMQSHIRSFTGVTPWK